MKDFIYSILTNQYTLGVIFGIVMNIIQYILSSKNTQDKNIKNELLQKAIAESSRLVTTELSNPDKLNQVVDFMYNYIPENYKSKISKEQLEQIANIAYHQYVKK